ncbi:MAG TPA: transcription antitermination factor NusB, partial [Paracoccaceae bacterium]|nr:transcription antitermination factor NusB [Paracoccaceae bacterium]
MSDTQDARAMAAYVVNMVTEQGRALDDALESVQANGGVAERDRALLRELSYGVLRWYQRLAYRANENLHKPVKSRDR